MVGAGSCLFRNFCIKRGDSPIHPLQAFCWQVAMAGVAQSKKQRPFTLTWVLCFWKRDVPMPLPVPYSWSWLLSAVDIHLPNPLPPDWLGCFSVLLCVNYELSWLWSGCLESVPARAGAVPTSLACACASAFSYWPLALPWKYWAWSSGEGAATRLVLKACLCPEECLSQWSLINSQLLSPVN